MGEIIVGMLLGAFGAIIICILLGLILIISVTGWIFLPFLLLASPFIIVIGAVLGPFIMIAKKQGFYD